VNTSSWQHVARRATSARGQRPLKGSTYVSSICQLPPSTGVKRKLTGIVPSGETSARVFRTIGSGSVGAQLGPATTALTGSVTWPSSVGNVTDTASAERLEPVLRAKKRRSGCASVTHIVGVVALLPAGSESECDSPFPWTSNGSLPLTTFAPPASVQPVSELSKVPPGTSV